MAHSWIEKSVTRSRSLNGDSWGGGGGGGGELFFPAHRIRISEILPWDRKSYLTHVILPRLSRDDYIHWLYWNSRTLSSSDVVVMLK